MFTIRLGVPEMEQLWKNLTEKNRTGTANKDEIKLYKKLGKTLAQISKDPRQRLLDWSLIRMTNQTLTKK